ncbi:hypothetical protein LYNGBM3L_21070 [Moorena producens 3L]|uniref:Uncharacterized protein n=1 Tax=Moorena producens 3L TaxID=489825 RepID=F4XN40_9CYAN|nr:hypothetical protein LYNGBM3L_21070 [Moorena producens 3L]
MGKMGKNPPILLLMFITFLLGFLYQLFFAFFDGRLNRIFLIINKIITINKLTIYL